MKSPLFTLRVCILAPLVLLLFLKLIAANSPRLWAVSDHFIMVNEQEIYQQGTDDRGEWHNAKADVNRLLVLGNDVVFGLPDKYKTCVMKTRNTSHQRPSKLDRNWFEDVHKDAGIHHIHRQTMAARPFCLFDFVIPHLNSSRVTRLRGEFCVPEHLTGGAAVGDYDKDGLQDIFFTVFNKPSVLYRNNGDGTFTDVTKDVGLGPSRYASGAGWVDVDQDGDLDLYVTTVGDNRHYLYINYGNYFVEEAEQRNCSLQFENKRKLAGMTPNFGDFDNDGFLDIYVTEWILHSIGKPSASRLLRNLGYKKPGYFEDVTDSLGVNMDIYRSSNPLNSGTHSFGASFTDFDNDGWPELLVTADYGESRMFWNTNGKKFTECTRKCGLIGEQDAMGHAIGDWDNDGRLDWFSTAIFHNHTDCSVTGCVFGRGGNRLYRNQGKKMFEDATDKAGVRHGGWGWGAAFIDFNNDGYLDFVMTNGVDFPSTTTDDNFMKQQMILWQNLGSGYNGSTKEVANAVGLNATGQGRGLLKVDYDDDGDEDIVVCNNLGPPQLYRNNGGNNNNWIKIQVVHGCLVYYDRMCDSYGARVQVMTSDHHLQTQEIGSNTHFMGQSELTAHFGLGANNGSVTVRVTWPSTSFEVILHDVIPNRKYRVHKPSWQQMKQNISWSQLPSCPYLEIMSIDKQPSLSDVSVNKDGRTVAFKLGKGVDKSRITIENFEYRVGLRIGDRILLNKTVSASVTINSTKGKPVDSGECKDGRHKGAPIPSPTDYRRLDGYSNNKDHVTWGAAMENLSRDFPAAYQDQYDIPSGTCSAQQRTSNTCRFSNEMSGYGSNRPSPRNVSNVLFHQIESIISARRLSDMHAHYGQFLAHDTDFSSPLPRFEFESTLNSVWMPISVPKGDVVFDRRNTGEEYLSFVRSTFNRCTGKSHGLPREQINKISSYIDGSVIYGESKTRTDHLRTMRDGKMKLDRQGIIPPNTMGIANDNVVGREVSRLLVAGDTRANVQPGLIALHSLFVREHNRLCAEYLKKKPKANDEEVFQYARKMIIAELQAITYREYLPALLGRTLPSYKGYDKDVNVAVTNTMATAAFRFGHSQVGNHVFRLNNNGVVSEYGHLPVRDSYFAPERVTREGGIEPVLRGAVHYPAQEIDLKVIDDLRNVLFPVARMNGLDLAAMNIQRGRDHGLPDYNTVRKAVGLKGLKDFSDLVRDKRLAQDMKALYGHVDNIDLWVGGLAEQHEDGSELGPTFSSIVRRNFQRIRDGDRFWYERILAPEDVEHVNSLTLGKIIRLNTDYKTAPDNVFFSTMHCSGVENYQCKSRGEQTESTDGNRDKTKGESTLPDNSSMLYGLIAVLVVLTAILAAMFVLLWRRKIVSPCNEKQLTEMNSIKNAAFDEQPTTTDAVKTV